MQTSDIQTTTRLRLALLALTLAFGIQPSALLLAAPLGTAFTYQGRLGVGTNAANGLYDLRFTLYDVASGPAQINLTVASAATPVTNGLFTVTLDFGAEAFNGEARWLEIAVRTNGSSAFTALSPRQPLTPSPYALYAPSAGNAALLDGQSPAAYAPATGSSAYVAKTGDTLSGGLVLPANGLTAGANQLVLSGGSVGIGTPSPSAALDVIGSVKLTDSVVLGANWVMRNDGPGIGPSWFGHFSGQDYDTRLSTTDYLSPAPNGKSAFLVQGANTDTDLIVDGRLGVLNDLVVGPSGTTLFGDASTGNVGIGTASPAAKLDVAGAVKATALNVGTNNVASARGAVAIGEGNQATNTCATAMGYLTKAAGSISTAMGYFAMASHDRTFVWADSWYTPLGVPPPGIPFASTGPGQFLIRASGGVGINTASPQAALDVSGNILISGDLQLNGSVKSRLDVAGRVYAQSLTITGGADLAEPFHISTKDIPKGSVVVIDENSLGQLKLSGKPYDKKVAGVISGANGIQPGVTLRQDGVADGEHNVALSGRVYVQADACNGPIEPGDLLTTSATPGHAMKVTDHTKAQGAIFGKAMSSLKEGQGMVLMLVSLQ